MEDVGGTQLSFLLLFLPTLGAVEAWVLPNMVRGEAEALAQVETAFRVAMRPIQ